VIVVVGSRHDPVAVELARRWPGAALCGAEDLMAPGWSWSADGERTWVVGGSTVADREVTGVFVRRTAVLPEELRTTHPEDRAYLAAEAQAMLVFVLATTGATVVNPVEGGLLGLDAFRPERWMPIATALGVPVTPLRLTSAACEQEPPGPPSAAARETVEVVDGAACDGSPSAGAAETVATALGLRWAVAVFDGEGGLAAMTAAPRPSPAAAARLGELLATSAGAA